MAENAGLLSLPDGILALVALQTREKSDRPLKDWIKAATTCKKLWELQLTSYRVLHVTWECEEP